MRYCPRTTEIRPNVATTRPHYVALACESLFSLAVLNGLCRVPPAAVVYLSETALRERATRELPVTAPTGVFGSILRADWPVIQVQGKELGSAYEEVSSLDVDLLVLACFPVILRRDWLGLGRQGTLNVHPSLLPAYRGPSPLFWQRRNGEIETGVTVHWATDKVDAGPIVAQASFPMSLHEEDAAIIRRQGSAGAALLRAILPALAVTGASGSSSLPGRTQDESLVTSYGWPH